MFTGIVEASPAVAESHRRDGRLVVALDLPESMHPGLKLGDSIAVNGVCLTVASWAAPRVTFEAIPETLRLTNLGDLKVGARVNLERALAAGGRMDGHIVQGHVDAAAPVESVTESGGEWRIRIRAGREFCAGCVLKGSVCVNGVSLTIADLDSETFTVAIIPHTWAVTNLSGLRAGMRVNLEADVLGKYVRRAIEQVLAVGGGITTDLLRKHGYMT